MGSSSSGSQTSGLGLSGVLGAVGVAFLWALCYPLITNTTGAATSIEGLLYVLLGALGVAAGNVLMKRYASRLDAVSTTGWQLIVGAAVLFAAVWVGRPAASMHWTPNAALAFVALFSLGTAVSFALWLSLLRRAPLHSLNVFTFLTPPFALGIGVMFYGESLGLLDVVGMVLVVGGAWLAAGRLREGSRRASSGETS